MRRLKRDRGTHGRPIAGRTAAAPAAWLRPRSMCSPTRCRRDAQQDVQGMERTGGEDGCRAWRHGLWGRMPPRQTSQACRMYGVRLKNPAVPCLFWAGQYCPSRFRGDARQEHHEILSGFRRSIGHHGSRDGFERGVRADGTRRPLFGRAVGHALAGSRATRHGRDRRPPRLPGRDRHPQEGRQRGGRGHRGERHAGPDGAGLERRRRRSLRHRVGSQDQKALRL